MVTSTNWLKSFQSMGRGIRNEELHVIASGKSMTIDLESDTFQEWRDSMALEFLTYYAEYYDYDTNETYWKKFSRKPRSKDMYLANNVVRKNDDGSYEYIKNRQDGSLRKLTEQEIVWLLLKVGG